ncbi:MAG: hypothetical protein KatS3mg111_3882 [Pirellulaceae bacterium]|nr:MAG: hypothetical protein KatS3mg111_3882 [Pirellulaceae bacterium]
MGTDAPSLMREEDWQSFALGERPKGFLREPLDAVARHVHLRRIRSRKELLTQQPNEYAAGRMRLGEALPAA